MILPFSDCRVNEAAQCLACRAWFLSLGRMPLCFLHVIYCIYLQSFRFCRWVVFSCVDVPIAYLFTAWGTSDCLQLQACVTKAAVLTHEQISVWASVFIPLGCSARVFAGSYGRCVFNSIRNWQTIYRSGYTISPSHFSPASILCIINIWNW